MGRIREIGGIGSFVIRAIAIQIVIEMAMSAIRGNDDSPDREVWGLSGFCNARRFAVAGPAVVVTCTWKGAVALAARVIGAGITVHVAPAGAPEQVRVTGPAKPSMDFRLS
jgi:hypothetical protein